MSKEKKEIPITKFQLRFGLYLFVNLWLVVGIVYPWVSNMDGKLGVCVFVFSAFISFIMNLIILLIWGNDISDELGVHSPYKFKERKYHG